MKGIFNEDKIQGLCKKFYGFILFLCQVSHIQSFPESETYFDNFVFFDRCGHCKKLAPEFEKLGTTFKKAKSVLIAKVSSL